jgi:PAS domain S-box-containing protein
MRVPPVDWSLCRREDSLAAPSMTFPHVQHLPAAGRRARTPRREAATAPIARGQIVPTGVERPWSDDEIIVSKTDLTGRITYANDVFLRVSQYTGDEIVGAPHSIIRHPDTPRTVFRLLWEGLQAEREVFAYVKNMARSGDHYWVFAHVTPSFGADGRVHGYHSNRRTVDRHVLPAIEALYGELLAAERGHTLKQDAIAASTALLERTLAARGMSYDEFVWRV